MSQKSIKVFKEYKIRFCCLKLCPNFSARLSTIQGPGSKLRQPQGTTSLCDKVCPNNKVEFNLLHYRDFLYVRGKNISDAMFH